MAEKEKDKKVTVEVPEGGSVEVTVKAKSDKQKKEESGGRRRLLG